MDNNNLSKFIQNYLNGDKTRSAIMLTGEWGTGKSYYIENVLIPFLNENLTDPNRCIVIPLYGFSTISEISQALLLQELVPAKSNGKNLPAKALFANTTNFILQTLVKTSAAHLQVDLADPRNTIDSLTEALGKTCANGSSKLIIFEDLERTSINLGELMGYINFLVEHNNRKVLLVANEKALIKEKTLIDQNKCDSDNQEYKSVWWDSRQVPSVQYTEATMDYLRMKEKTVSDTIQFEGNFEEAIINIIKIFEVYLAPLYKSHSDTMPAKVLEIMNCCESHNLRAFLFACQKTENLFSEACVQISTDDYKLAVFYGIIAFSLRLKKGNVDLSENMMSWGDETYYSLKLGSRIAPLFRFCYEYIMHQELDEKLIKETLPAFELMRRYDRYKSQNDPDLKILKDWKLHSVPDIEFALHQIEKRLNTASDISYFEYGNIVSLLLQLRKILPIPSFDDIVIQMANNLKGEGQNLMIDWIFELEINDKNDPDYVPFHEIKEKMRKALGESSETLMGYNYIPEKLDDIIRAVKEQPGAWNYDSLFIACLNPEKMAHLFLECNSAQMDKIQKLFKTVYTGNARDLSVDAHKNLTTILTVIQNSPGAFDAIQRFHIEEFTEWLGNIVK